MDTVNAIFIYIFLLLSTLLSYYFLVRKRRRDAKRVAQLPPGSMGWPYVGETLQMYSQDPDVFFAAKEKRYGEIFKSHILGYPCVMLASPEAVKFVLVTHAYLFKPTYPRGKEKMIGPSALFFHQGHYHTHLRKLVQTSLAPETIKKLIPDIESIAIASLDSWVANDGQIINTYNEMKKFSFDVGILFIFGNLDGSHREKLKNNYNIVNKGYNSFPTNIPGTAYHKALLARKRLCKIVNEIIRERKEKRIVKKDLLGHLLNSKDGKGQALTEDQIADNIIGVLFAAQDTTASGLTWILKYLLDNQKLMEDVKAEQKAIYESNTAAGKRSLTWQDTKNMLLTHTLILESLRMASIISFTFREAVVDVEYRGYLIPKGWKVMPLFRNIHHNPEFFSEPKKFDPSRFEVAPKPYSFMPFGNGLHACPGRELAKLEMLILIHHLLTNFRWDLVGSQSGIQYGPFPVPQQGLPARFWKEAKSSTCVK
ncbi:abscisic acid 8'-hydroxylase 4-like [Mangifera indica]|uniref:abscisic acid 8'-hydroxylase 4-like n=1 Tax=Mangifera indica TaxID=29780 RepID=UPI001CF9B58A|nr:abscisic acid 8'-hydroxylase 4-like [Mangifera indica]